MHALRTPLLVAVSTILAAPASAGWISLDEADGLPPSGVTSLAVDPAKRLWAGTADQGVGVFDGVTWTVHGVRDLPSNQIQTLATTRPGDMWVGTSAGAARFRDGVWTTFPDVEIARFAEEPEGGMWALTRDDGLRRYDGSNATAFLPELRSGTDLVVDELGGVTAAGSGGLFRGDSTGFTPLAPPAGLGAPRFLLHDAAGVLWLAAADGTARLTGGSWEVFSGPGTPGSVVEVTALGLGGDGSVWVGTQIGAWRHDDPGWTWISEADRIPFGTVTTILAGPGEETWFAGAGSQEGLSRFDGWGWQVFRVGEGLGEDAVTAMARGPDGAIWTGSASPVSSVSRFDGEFWKILDLDEGVPGTRVDVIRSDASGDLWVGADLGLARLSPEGLVTESTAGLSDRNVRDLAPGSARPEWVATGGEAAVWSGADWSPRLVEECFSLDGTRDAMVVGTRRGTFVVTDTSALRLAGIDSSLAVRAVLAGSRSTWLAQDQRGVHRLEGLALVETLDEAAGLISNGPLSLLETADGDLWIGTDQGLSIYHGTGFTNLRDVPGLASNGILSLFQDSAGLVWLGTNAGVTRHDGQAFLSYGPADGLAGSLVNAIAEDPVGNLVFGGTGGLTLHGEDRVPPLTVIRPALPPVSPSPRQTIAYVPGFGDAGIEFQWRSDGGPWGPWQTETFTILEKLEDGPHVFEVRGRDRLGNVEQLPAAVEFTIDSTPPSPSLVSPVFGEAVSGVVEITGAVVDPRLQGWILELVPASGSGSILAFSEEPVDGVLHTWDTTRHPDGDYTLRLQATDTLGLNGILGQRVIVDNEAPFAEETTPVRIRSAAGGDVWTTGREAHVYVGPGALAEDATVSLVPWTPPPTGVVGIPLLSAWRVVVEPGGLRKPLVLDVSLDGTGVGTDSLRFARYEDRRWISLGGSPIEGGTRFAVPLADTGSVALFGGDPGVRLPAPPLAALSLAPRAFAPGGGFGGTGRPSPSPWESRGPSRCGSTTGRAASFAWWPGTRSSTRG